MLVFRLSRIGKKKQPYFRVVVQEKHRDPWSPAIDVVGTVDPRVDRKDAQLDTERINHWLSKGVQPSPSVHNLFVELGLVTADKMTTITISNKRAGKIAQKAKKIADEKTKKEAEAKAAAEVAAE